MAKRTWAWAVVCFAVCCAVASAQCVSVLQPISQIAVFPNHEAGPVAWTGSSFGLSKLDAGDPLHNPIYFATYDANLNPVTGEQLVSATSLSGPLAVLWTGSEFGVFYQAQANQALTLQRMSASGNAIGGPVNITATHVQFPGQDFDFAWDPTRQAYVIFRAMTIGFERGVWLTLVAPDGSVKSDDELTFNISDIPSPRVAVTSTGIIGVLWSRTLDQQELAFGIATPGQPLPNITSVVKNASSPRMATNGSSFLVVYRSPASGGTTEIRSARLDTSGRVVSPDARLVAPTGIDVIPDSLVANTTLGEWGLLYRDYSTGALSVIPGDMRLRRIAFDSSIPQSDTVFPSDPAKQRLQPTSNLLVAGGAYAGSIGQTRTRAEGTESYLVRDCPLVVTATANPTFNQPFQPLVFTAQPSGGNGPYTYSWTFGDISAPLMTQTATHQYRDFGTYTATVTVTDTFGQTAVGRVTVRIIRLWHRAAGK